MRTSWIKPTQWSRYVQSHLSTLRLLAISPFSLAFFFPITSPPSATTTQNSGPERIHKIANNRFPVSSPNNRSGLYSQTTKHATTHSRRRNCGLSPRRWRRSEQTMSAWRRQFGTWWKTIGRVHRETISKSPFPSVAQTRIDRKSSDCFPNRITPEGGGDGGAKIPLKIGASRETKNNQDSNRFDSVEIWVWTRSILLEKDEH